MRTLPVAEEVSKKEWQEHSEFEREAKKELMFQQAHEVRNPSFSANHSILYFANEKY